MTDKKFRSVVSSTSAKQQRPTPDAGIMVDRLYAVPPDDHTIYYLVGRVAAEWARLEHALDQIIWHLSASPSHRVSCLTAQIMGTGPRFSAIAAQLLSLSLVNYQYHQYISVIEKIKNKSFEPQERRNRIVHDPWLVDTVHDQPAQFRAWPRKSPSYGIFDEDYSNIEKTIEDISALTKRVKKVLSDIQKDVDDEIEPLP